MINIDVLGTIERFFAPCSLRAIDVILVHHMLDVVCSKIKTMFTILTKYFIAKLFTITFFLFRYNMIFEGLILALQKL